MCASGCGFGDTACGWQAMCARELLCPHEERPGPEFFWMNHVASCSAAWVERGCDCRHPVPRCPVLAIAGLRCDPFSACRRQALHGHSAGPQLECSACRRPYVCSLGPSRGSDESLNCQPCDECDEGPSHFRLAGDADKLLRLNPWFHYRSLKLCSRICMPQLLWLHFCCSRLPADWRQEHVLGFFYLADGAVFKLEDLDVPVNSTDGADVLDCTDEGQASLVPFATTPPWLAWMECLATSVSLSWFGLLFAALLRLLCFGMQLKGGERNWDPIVRGGRAVLRGGPMSILIFAAMICSTAGMPNFPDSAPINNEHYHFLRELMLFDRDMQITASMHPAVRPVHNASEAAAPPDPDNFPFSPTTSNDAESGGSDPWKRMAVRVFMYGRTDFYTSVWIREGSSELAVISAIADGLLLDPDQLRVTVVRPQTPSDTVDVAVTPTWWQEGGITFFILEGSEVSRPTYMCTLPAAPTYADLRAAVGPHLVSGISLYWRNERVPINPDAELQIQSGDLLRLRFDGRVRVHLPDIVEALQDVYWARDLDRLGLPENPSPKGRLLVLYKDYRYILRVDENITKDELHAKLARQIRSTTDAERLLLPQGEFEQPAHRGIPLTTVAALCPHASFSTGQHTAVFIDARDLGQPIHFQLHESADLTASDFVAGMDFCPPPGFSVHADGSVEPIAGTGNFSCSTGCCFAIWCDRDNARDHPVRGPSILQAMPGDSTYLDDNVASSEDSGSVRARSRTPRRLAIAPTSQSSGWARAGRDEDAAHLPVQFHAVVYRLQRPPFYRLVHGRHPFTLTSLEAMVHDALFNGDQDWELIPLRPQQDGIAFQFLVTSSWCFDAGLFPCLIDGEWFGIPSFVAMVGPAIRAADVRAILSADWPSGAVIYVLGGHMLDDNEETFVHRGMAVVLRAAGAPPPAYVNTDDKVVSAFTAEQPVVVQPLNIVGDFPDHVACLGKDFADIMFRCETGFRGQMQTYAARHTGYLEEEFHIVSAARDLPDFYCRGLPVSTFLGIQLQHDEFHVGCFIDARDLGYNVKFALLPHSATSLTELFQLAGIDRPPGFAFNVSGVLYTPSSELLIVGQRSVISISVVKDTGVDASDTCSALSFPDGPEGDDDQLDGGGDGHSPDATDRRSSAASEDGNRSGPPSGPVPAGPTQRGGEFPTSCFGCVDAMWKHAFQQDAILYCQQVDTSGSPQPLRTLLELSDPQPRRQLLGNIWTMLQTDGQESCTTGSVSTVQPVPISLEICLPIAASSPPTYDNFDMHYSQCMMPISPAMLHDFDRCIPLGQTRRPPEGLRSPGRFFTWIKQATYGRLPGPDEELVVTSDGAYHPTTGAAGWGIVLSIRQCCDHTASDLVGCLWGPMGVLGEVLSDALCSLGAYAAEMVGLLWSALVVLQLKWRRKVTFRCDCAPALDGVHGRADCRPHPVCLAARALHLALFCVLGHEAGYEHVRGHSGDVSNELADALANHGAMGHTGCTPFGLDFRTWFQDGELSFSWLAHFLWDQSHPEAGPKLQDGLMAWDPQPPTLQAHPQQVISPFLRALPATGSHVARQHDLSIDVTWATFNALSLAGGGEAVQLGGGLHHSVGRVKSLCTSLLQAGIHICGLQEARTPQGVARIGPFWRCSSGSDGGGNFGNELWVHLEWPFACGPHGAVRFQTEDFLVMHAEATILLIRVSNGVVDWRIAVLHAPHRGHELSHRKQWWGRARDLCQAHGAGHAWFVLADSNARVGACTSEFIGSYHADPECESGVLFHDFLRDLEVMIPSTFEGIMQGSSATLVQKRNGGLARCDFVGVPFSLSSSWMQAWVDARVSAGHGHLDHFASVLRMVFSCTRALHSKGSRSKKIDASALRDDANIPAIEAIIRASPCPGWQVSVHEHAAMVTEHLYSRLAHEFPLAERRMKRPCFSDASGRVHQALASTRNRLRRRKTALYNTYLRCVLQVWRDKGRTLSFTGVFTGRWLMDLHKHIAVDASTIGRLARELRRGCRADKRAYVQALAEELQQANPGDVHGAFRKLVKPRKFKRQGMAPLPRLRKTDGSFCSTAQEVQDRWLEHFASLEGGAHVTADDLVSSCMRAQHQRGRQLFISAKELPNLQDMVAAFKAVQSRRAPGPDMIPPEICRRFSFQMALAWWPVALKTFCLGCEAVGLKGGMQCRLQKPHGDRTLCSSSRSVLLQPSVAKAFHRAARRLLVERFEGEALDFQIGGRKHYSAAFGSLCTRSLLR